MSNVNQALYKIARGAGIVSTGVVISRLFGFLSKVIIARYFSTSEYGVFNLTLTILSIALVIATLGFRSSLPREVSFYTKKNHSKLNDLISTALFIIVLNSLFWAVVLFLEAENISRLFDGDTLASALRRIVFVLPILAITEVLLSTSRGFGRVREKVYFQNIVYPVFFLVFIIVGALLKQPFYFVFTAYVLAKTLTFLILLVDIWRIKFFEFKFLIDPKIGKELIFFSLPLLFTGILGFVMSWTDTLMLGYYMDSRAVGVYNAAAPLSRMLLTFLNSITFLYLPIASQFYAQGEIREFKKIYQIVTKWIFFLTFSFFLLMFLFPEATIVFFFGEKYLKASTSLQVLAFGFMFHTFLGPNGLSLTVIGQTKLAMFGNLFAAIVNILLNVLLIPIYGIEGAAVATAVSYFIYNVFKSYWLYKKTKIHPFNRNYIKALVIGFVPLGLFKMLNIRTTNIFLTGTVLISFLGIYIALILFTKSLDKEDTEVLLTIEKKLRIRLKK